jgi:hypothetical protein
VRGKAGSRSFAEAGTHAVLSVVDAFASPVDDKRRVRD